MNVNVYVGRLAKDVELKYTPSGVAYARVTLAVGDGNFKDGKEGVDWIPLLLWKKNAENASQFIRKGSLVSVKGRYKSNSYQNTDGKMVYGHDIVVDEIKYLDKKETSTQPQQQSEDPFTVGQSQPQQQQQQPGYNPAANVPQGEFGFNR